MVGSATEGAVVSVLASESEGVALRTTREGRGARRVAKLRTADCFCIIEERTVDISDCVESETCDYLGVLKGSDRILATQSRIRSGRFCGS